MKPFIQKTVRGEDLSVEETREAFELIMTGAASDAQIGALLTAMAVKGAAVSEITGAATVMRQKATRVKVTDPAATLDVVGTGGDSSGTFNISTCSAIVAAAAGAAVAKHGNRSVTSKSGSAEVLAELGVNIEADVSTVERCIAEAGIGFMFAPLMHGAMKYAIGPRREMGIRTIFNILGPLTNPAGAGRLLLGVFDPALTEVMANVLGELGTVRAWVVHGEPGVDEISLAGPTRVSELNGGNVTTFDVKPEDVGIERKPMDTIQVDSPSASAAVIRNVLKGAAGPPREAVLLNAGAALVVAGLADDWAGGVKKAAKAIDTGKAKATLETLVKVSNAIR